jgi:hypothetical protein
MRRQRDILVLTIRSLHVGEEFCCTSRSFEGIEERLEAYRIANPGRRFAIQKSNRIYTVRRVR